MSGVGSSEPKRSKKGLPQGFSKIIRRPCIKVLLLIKPVLIIKRAVDIFILSYDTEGLWQER